MRYLTLIPDYTGSCIQDDFDGKIEIDQLELPYSFIQQIFSWHSEYRTIIPLDNEQRNNKIEIIEELDNKGLKIARKLEELIPGGAKVKYYSEGKLKFLDT